MPIVRTIGTRDKSGQDVTIGLNPDGVGQIASLPPLAAHSTFPKGGNQNVLIAFPAGNPVHEGVSSDNVPVS